MRQLALVVLLAAAASGAAAAQDSPARDPRPVPVRRVADEAPHSAFTDLARFRGRLYCAFREGDRHVHGADGVARVLASDDGGASWRSVAALAVEGVDLRDPKLSVTPDGRLMLTLGGSVYVDRQLVERRPLVAFSDRAGESFSSPQRVEFDAASAGDANWLWRVTWRGDLGYGVVYQADEEAWGLHLVTTRDGVRYEHRAALPVDGRPNETTLRFADDGELLALVRREGGDRRGRVGRSRPPYTDWTWTDLPVRLGGPNFVVANDGTWIVATRRYPDAERAGTGTVLGRWSEAAGWEEWLELPSGGDTSYPGLVLEDDRLLVSYYSSHEGRAAIYFAEVELPPTRPRAAPAPIEFETYVDETGARELRGVFRVPENRALGPLGAGRVLTLDFRVFLATGADPAPDPVIFVAGGPGQAATHAFGGLARSPLRARRDLVLLDQRGTNGDHALRCTGTGNDADPQTYLDPLFQVAPFEDCARELARRADLTQYTSEIAADDLEEFRAALGYEKLNLVGGSYGTRASLVYMRRYPASVRTAVLDGVAPIAFKNPLHHAAAAQGALEKTLAACAADPACSAAFPDLGGELREVLARLERAPAGVTVPHPAGTGEAIEVRLTRDAFAEALRVLLYYLPTNRQVPRLVHAAFQGDLAPFAARGMAVNRALRTQLALGMLLCVTCAEDLARIAPEEVAAATAGTFLGDARVRAQLAVCASWPAAAVEPDYGDPVAVDVPTLVLSGTLDAVTPPRWGAEAARHLPRSLHVVAPGAHGVMGNPCVDGIVARFLEAGTVEGLDVGCVEAMRLPAFELGDARPAASPSLAEELERVVRTLAVDLVPRDHAHPENLDRAARFIAAEFAAAGVPSEMRAFEVDGETYRNVVARLGPREGERLVVGAHYDAAGEFPGADDNASGVAGLLQLARALADEDLPIGVEFVAYTLEEPPYFRTEWMGSRVHADSVDPRAVRAMIALEMIGYFSDEPGSQTYPGAPGPVGAALEARYGAVGDYLAVVGRPRDQALVERVVGAMGEPDGLRIVPFLGPRSLEGVDFSDHQNYWDREIPAAMLTDTAFFRNEAYHTANDTPERLDYARMARAVEGLARAVLELARSPR